MPPDNTLDLGNLSSTNFFQVTKNPSKISLYLKELISDIQICWKIFEKDIFIGCALAGWTLMMISLALCINGHLAYSDYEFGIAYDYKDKSIRAFILGLIFFIPTFPIGKRLFDRMDPWLYTKQKE
jgi:hypothetical protein